MTQSSFPNASRIHRFTYHYSRWDCNTTKYETFMPYFHCNFLRECELYEDESNCEYSSAACPNPHFITGKDSCFYFDIGDRWDSQMSWNDSFHKCRQMDDRYTLPTPYSRTKLIELFEFFRVVHGRIMERIFIGLHTNSSLPPK